MTNLDDEFDNLMEELHKLIRSRQVSGELTRAEADALSSMVEARLDHLYEGPAGSWNSSNNC